MELKYVAIKAESTIEEGSNRTFMELKFALSILRVVGLLVLIVPLWN